MEVNRCVYSKEEPQFFYMKICFDSESKLDLDKIRLKSMLTLGLKELHGDVGASLLVDVLHYNQKDSTAILRIDNKGLTQVWSSLSWFQTFSGIKVNIRVEKVSSSLISLSTDSRKFNHSLT
ncbi:Ribonuclease P protein subunit p14 [Chamberlinius hualienensis]